MTFFQHFFPFQITTKWLWLIQKHHLKIKGIAGGKLIVQGYVVKAANQLEKIIENRRSKMNIQEINWI